MASSGRVVRAAGALVWRIVGRHLEVLLIHRPRYDDWSWPKGKLDSPHESLPMCAVREVQEETGIPVVLGLPLPTVSYKLAGGVRKVCHYWAATPADVDGVDVAALNARPRIKPASKHEVDEARWVEAKKARKLLTRSDDLEPLGALMDYFEDGLLRTWTLLLVRHGRAKKRSAWTGGEASRPLTPVGRDQAKALVPIFAAYGVHEVISSPWLRCRATMTPYSDACDTVIVSAPQVTEAAARDRPAGVRALVGDLLGRPREATAVCTHRPVFPFVLEAVEARSPHRVAKQLPQENPYLRTGEVLVVHVSRRENRRARVVAVERHRPS
ncbi:NUDIX hydrolase [Ruania alba]|uniref:8-oxo-dGTP diphosphatase n=1 Tax=Ruania alba TaxID=648782 RepID=A0A1H5B8K1_9MICO|nr:bifunctional NUDIX hydrolase/histidine phosphatase family protein [Ruania alba]SED50745.1 8-oxo-dGTP diphosphatase [Ruania alba]